MNSNTSAALAFVFKDEGGYAERPEEGGGAVNRGITFTVFEAWRAHKGADVPTWADLKAMSVEEATEIYEEQYLKPIHFDELPVGPDYCVADAAVNGGVTGSIKLLQTALGLAPVDGHFGLVTRWAATHRPVEALIDKLCDARIAKYQTFTTRFNKIANPQATPEKQKTWGQIWTSRIEVVRGRAKSMIGTPAPLAAPSVIKASSLSFPPARSPMPASTELSKGMIKRGGTVEQFLRYLREEVAPRMGAWHPRMIVTHNTGKMNWPGIVNGKEISPEQRLDNMSVDWQNRHFAGGPHLVLPPDGMVWAAWPLWKPGTHSPSWNALSWGIETVGDWNTEIPSAALLHTLPIVTAGLCAMIGIEPNGTTMRDHLEDPKTSHKNCPGPNLGSKASRIAATLEQLHLMNPHS